MSDDALCDLYRAFVARLELKTGITGEGLSEPELRRRLSQMSPGQRYSFEKSLRQGLGRLEAEDLEEPWEQLEALFESEEVSESVEKRAERFLKNRRFTKE